MAHHAAPETYVLPADIDRKAAEWLAELAGLNREVKLRPGRCGLLVVDMQRFFFEPGDEAPVLVGDAVRPRASRMVRGFRQAGRPVVFTRHAHEGKADLGVLGEWWDDFVREGTEAAALVEELVPRPQESVIVKRRYSAFAGTGLEAALLSQGVADLVIAGVMTNLCCETTAREAFVRDFRVFFLADATATATEAMHRASLLNLAYGFARVSTVSEVEDWLGPEH